MANLWYKILFALKTAGNPLINYLIIAVRLLIFIPIASGFLFAPTILVRAVEFVRAAVGGNYAFFLVFWQGIGKVWRAALLARNRSYYHVVKITTCDAWLDGLHQWWVYPDGRITPCQIRTRLVANKNGTLCQDLFEIAEVCYTSIIAIYESWNEWVGYSFLTLLTYSFCLVAVWPILSAISAYIHWRYQLTAANLQCGNTEGMRPSSAFRRAIKDEKPGCSADVLHAGAKVGNAVRLGEWIVLPVHLFGDTNKLLMVTGENTLFLYRTDGKEVFPDVWVHRLTTQQWSVTGLKKAKLAKLIGRIRGKMYTGGAINHEGPQITLGDLQDSKTFGLVDYTGSTLPGCSGGLYMLGNSPIAMHLYSAGTTNTGVSLAFIMKLLEV